MIASILPRSTSTVRVSLPCCTTPETMSPSTPEKWPYFCSSSTSRNRCMMTCRAVDAATRPKPSGVLSYSPTLLPASSSSGTITLTWPVFRFTSTRPPGTAPSVFSYAVSRASSIAFTSTANGTSFSRSINRSTEMSMSI